MVQILNRNILFDRRICIVISEASSQLTKERIRDKENGQITEIRSLKGRKIEK